MPPAAGLWLALNRRKRIERARKVMARTDSEDVLWRRITFHVPAAEADELIVAAELSGRSLELLYDRKPAGGLRLLPKALLHRHHGAEADVQRVLNLHLDRPVAVRDGSIELESRRS
jgi:hypothetical protein